jgi:hypothetical protein
MPHIPINHRLRPFYRLLATLAGAYVLVFGIIGVTRTAGDPLFERGDVTVLGLRSNLAFAILSIIVGIIVLGGALYGRNLDHFINLGAGVVFLGAGILMLTVLQTSANFLNYTVATCVVSFVIGLVLLTAGLYGKVGTPAEQAAHEAHRHHKEGDPAPSKLPHRPPSSTDPDAHRFA